MTKDSISQVRVEMGAEPAHFLSIFNGTFLTIQGGKELFRMHQL
jgi:hypothetical protein